MAIIGLELKKAGRLDNDTVVVTVMSNLGFDIMAQKTGSNCQDKVGDRYVLEEMLDRAIYLRRAIRHVIFLKYNTTGDGLLTALQLLSVISRQEGSFDLASVMRYARRC